MCQSTTGFKRSVHGTRIRKQEKKFQSTFTIGRIFKCSICKEEFVTNKECITHVLTVHKYQLQIKESTHAKTVEKIVETPVLIINITWISA